MENKEIRKLDCPMCGAELEYKKHGETHIYSCLECPLLALEWFGDQNSRDLLEYLK
jgi:hypothetical protein